MQFAVCPFHSDRVQPSFHAQLKPRPCPAGLPEAWVADDALTFGPGSFSLEGKLPPVASNAFLVKGLFADSIPLLLEQQRMWATGANGSLSAEGYRRWQKENDAPLSYLHIDCDLFIGARDAFTLLNHKIVAGTVILFDELINYNQYKEHEVSAGSISSPLCV